MAGSLAGAPSFKRVDATVKGPPTYDEFVGTHGGTSTSRLAAAWRKRFQPSHSAQGAARRAHTTTGPSSAAHTIGTPAGTTGTAPSASDPTLDGLQPWEQAQARFFDAQTKAQQDQATAAYSALSTAARGDADALARRLGALSAAAGATNFQGNTADPRLQALTGILGQDAQQRQVIASGEAIRQSSDLPTLAALEGQSKVSALGAQRQAARQQLIGGFQETNAKLQSEAANRAVQSRGQNLQYLGMIGATNAKVDIANLGSQDKAADRIAKLKAERARLQTQIRIARERNDTSAANAATAAQAKVDAAITRAQGSGGNTGANARSYATLRSKVTKDLTAAANVKLGTQAYDSTTGALLYHTDPKTGEQVPTMASQTTGGMSAKDVLTNALARGLRPADAWQVMAAIWGITRGQKTPTAAGESPPHGVLLQYLTQRVGAARARRAVKQITGFDPMGG